MDNIEAGGRKRSANLDVNLVPFIDLMSVLITFLLITAVWTQVSMIQIGSSIYGKKDPGKPSPPVPTKADVVLKLEIKAAGYLLTVGMDTMTIPASGDNYDDTKLIELLQRTKEKHPEKTDGAISMSDELPYERLIRGMDAFLKSGFPSISVLTGGPN